MERATYAFGEGCEPVWAAIMEDGPGCFGAPDYEGLGEDCYFCRGRWVEVG